MESDKKDDLIICIACQDPLERNHDGISCAQSHHLCKPCSVEKIGIIMGDPETNIPVKCQVCKVELNSAQIEKLMTESQLDTYLTYKLAKEIDPRLEKMAHCPFCNYYEIWDINSSSNFFFCRNPKCLKGSCSVCFKEFEVVPDSEISSKKHEEMKRDGGMLSHYKCYEHKEAKEKWDKAIATGIQRFCPGWGVGGIKDDDCTHMNWGNCKTVWCYICGKSEDEWDKEDPEGNIFSHNDDWHLNEKRCPMYFLQIGQIDPRWSTEDDEEAKNFFHKILAYKKIRKFLKEYSLGLFDPFFKAFPSIKNCGFDIEEAMSMDLTLIHRAS